MTPTMPETVKDVQGWFDFQDYYWRVAQGIRNNALIVELGPWLGLSTVFLAKSLEILGKTGIICAIDTWKGSPNEQDVFDYVIRGSPVSPKERFWNTVLTNGVSKFIEPLCMDSVEASHGFSGVDFVFFDTEHTEEHLSKELVAWIPKLKPGALFGGHDIAIPGVRRAVEKHVKNWKEVGPCWEAINV